jgi:hypothetical protein
VSRPTGFYQTGIGAVFFVEHLIGSDFTWTGSDLAWVAEYDKTGVKSAKDAKGVLRRWERRFLRLWLNTAVR